MTSADVESLFLDTNVLVYANVAQAPLHQLALQTIQAYDASGRQLWISRQIIREYLATVTRPQTFATAMPMGLAVARARYFQQRFHVAEETADVTTRLLALLEQVPTAGAQVHDANIVATMQVYGIRHLLTHNTADFARYTHLITLVPFVPIP
ncbi:MAG TPA: PIN domain-containing protein [Herpetosiphonaceae bacterium]|nr:PIN domain-containing protein [Herpetosiphonaceae bacterium]